jgi:F-type H+-transporting ATPase subunit delta
MPNPRLATRYAKSLIDLSLEQGSLEQVYEDMKWLQGACKSNRDLVNLLKSPIINPDVKKKILAAVTDGKLSKLTNMFNDLLISKGRESDLPEIAAAFVTQYNVYKNIHVVKLTTATPVNEAVKNAVIAQVKKAGQYDQIQLETKVDESIIGGFVLQIEDKLIDASIAYDLKAIARQFENNDFIYKIR